MGLFDTLNPINLADKGIDLIDGAASDVGGAVRDFSRVGRNNYQDPGFQWGGEQGAQGFSDMALQGMGGAQGYQNWAAGQMKNGMSPGDMAYENADLANRELATRNGDQAGALQLSREAAMGMAPSAAAMQLQSGLNAASNAQRSQAGSARGSAAIAQAQSQGAGQIAGLQANAFNQAAQLRAQEMAQARGQYGQLAGQVREQDLGRLNMGNQMSQFNTAQNNQYKLGMGNLANQYGQQAQGWFQGSMAPWNAAADVYNQQQARASGVAQANADQATGMKNFYTGLGGSVVKTTGDVAAANGQKKPPTG